jgi:hypothetical protein
VKADPLESKKLLFDDKRSLLIQRKLMSEEAALMETDERYFKTVDFMYTLRLNF